MRRRWWVMVLAPAVGVIALAWPEPSECAAQASPAVSSASASASVSASASASVEPPSVPHSAEAPAPDLSAAVARAVEAGVGVALGLAVTDLDTGAAAGHNADTPFRSASLSKLLVAVDMLTSGEVPSADLERLERALRLSDDDAMNALWTLHDGMGAIARVAAQAGLTATRAPVDASQWGDVEMSAADVVKLYGHIAGLTDAHRDFITTALSTASPTAADGFDQAYGLFAPGVDGYVKQGWMWYLPADFHLHSTGVVGDRYAVAVLSVQSGVGEQAAKDHLTAITNALITAVSPTG